MTITVDPILLLCILGFVWIHVVWYLMCKAENRPYSLGDLVAAFILGCIPIINFVMTIFLAVYTVGLWVMSKKGQKIFNTPLVFTSEEQKKTHERMKKAGY